MDANELSQANHQLNPPVNITENTNDFDGSSAELKMEFDHNEAKCAQNTTLLLNIFYLNKKKHRVLLHYDKLIWEKENTHDQKQTVPISDVISVKIAKQKNTRLPCCTQRPQRIIQQQQKYQQSGTSINSTVNDYETTMTTNEKHFLNIYYGKRLEKSKADYNRWRKHSVEFYNSDIQIIRLWYDTISLSLRQQNRPQRILMFINPYGGRKQGRVIFDRYSKPLLDLADIDVKCVISQRPNQIRDIIMTETLDAYDAVCCIGGDGTFSEVFNGLVYREMHDRKMDPLRPPFIPKPRLPIGIIPAGSTDTIAFCIHGTTDIKTAVIHIILGQKRGLDLSSVCNNNGLIKVFASIMSYGYLGDVAYDSENYRWLGPKRYDYSGFKKIIANRGYTGEIILFDAAENIMPSNNKPSTSDIIKTKCLVNCNKCQTKSIRNNDNKNNIDYAVITPPYQNNNGKSNQTQTTNNLKRIKGKFFMISGANISCACSRSPNGFSPYAHLGDGYLNIILVRHTTFLNNIRLLLHLKKSNGDISDLPFVEIYKTRKLFFRASKPSDENSIVEDVGGSIVGSHLSAINNSNDNEINGSFSGSCQPINIGDTKTSQWNCDGEVIHNSDIFVSSHCQLVDVFMRGPYSAGCDSTNGNPSIPFSCCASCSE